MTPRPALRFPLTPTQETPPMESQSREDRTLPAYPNPHPVYGPRPDPYDHEASEAVWSTLTINGQRLAWHEAAVYWQHETDLYRGRANAWGTLVRDLTRCEHGRCEGDVCGGIHPRGCNGPSLGNPVVAFLGSITDHAANEASQDAIVERLAYAAEQGRLVPRTIGFGLEAQPIVVPERARVHDPAAWRVQPDATEGV